MADDGTYLEDFLMSLEMLPNNFRRECELLKELDREVIEVSAELSDMESTFLANLTKLKELSADDDRIPLQQQNEKIKGEMDALRDRASKKIAEKNAMVVNLISIFDQFSNKLGTDLAQFETELKNAGEYEAPPGLPVDTEVAFRVSADRQETTLILGQVLQFKSEIHSYEILDVDDKRKYVVPDNQVFPLGQLDITTKKLSKGDRIHALYPDTTIFYPALVIQAPRRSALSSEAIVTVQFESDEDPATGLTPNRVVQLKHIVRLPAT